MKHLALALLLTLGLQPAIAQERIVALGGCVTEMLYALGDGGAVAGVDSSSTYPEAARRLPQVGYHRALSAEGLMSLKPTLVIGTSQAGPPPVFEKLRAAGVPVALLPEAHSLEGALKLLQAVADLRGKGERGRGIVDGIRAQLAQLPRHDKAPSVLVMLAAQGTPLAAGADTAAALMIGLAGGRNAAAAFTGYKPLSAEALAGLAPDVIVLPEHVLPMLGGVDALLTQPGLAQTPAARQRRVVVMDSQLLLGLGPRLGDAALALARQIQGKATHASR